jgi:predicted DCC family thiol-disulfide oxidoreductase YuxK
MEGIAKNIRVYDKNCVGCKKFKKDVMVSFMIKEDETNDIHDIFFTTEQAESLRDQLTKKLEQNKE